MSPSQKKSPIWLHFTEIITGQKAKCNICRNANSFKGGTTGNLRKHLRIKHPTVVLDEEQQKEKGKQIKIKVSYTVIPNNPLT